MKLYELDKILLEYEKQLSTELFKDLEKLLDQSVEAYPFNEFELRLAFFQEHNIISFKKYEEIRNEYIASNKYLELYGLAPRVFGHIWGESHILEKDNRIQKAHKSIDPEFTGEYDLWLEGIKVEVKASRAIDKNSRESLISKALEFDSDRGFWMNFQQLKLDICDIFIFIGVWTDTIKYLILTNKEVKENPYISHQHRGGVEYQIGITEKNITGFDKFLVDSDKILDYLLSKFE